MTYGHSHGNAPMVCTVSRHQQTVLLPAREQEDKPIPSNINHYHKPALPCKASYVPRSSGVIGIEIEICVLECNKHQIRKVNKKSNFQWVTNNFSHFVMRRSFPQLCLVGSIVMTWASEVISPHSEIRAMAIAIMNTSSSLMWTWVPLVLWPVTDAPFYHKGFVTGAILVVLFIISMFSIDYMQKEDGRVKRANSEGSLLDDEGEMPLLREQEEEEEEHSMDAYPHIPSSNHNAR
ncbi:hypothetical protein K501DRAFT_280344 [Backusella circina FSU 941]|nr:hypothetical protein K501DRAFT_280344 [Backusella circina FSU 941]